MAVSRPSLAGRVLLAILLTIGFYTLALGVIAGLLFLPYAEARYAHRVHARLAVGCLLGAGVIAWSILPRRDRFAPPGPRLEPDEHPRLFGLIADVARETQQAEPRDVYLISEVNAFVAQRGGVLGVGSRRVMGLGMPLLVQLSVAELRAVLAHEFGHFHGGDTKLGPWIHRTRMAILRTVESLGSRSWLQAPFRGYAKLFLRVTNAVSRRQEFVADELAARLTGSAACAAALRNTCGMAPAYAEFWKAEAVAVLKAGYRPPLAEGFSRFMSAPGIRTATAEFVDKMVKDEPADPYSSHPTLRERLAAVGELPPGDSGDTRAALTLLGDVAEQERRLLVHGFGTEQTQGLKPVEWPSVSDVVYRPGWDRCARDFAAPLSGLAAADLPGLLPVSGPLAAALREKTKDKALTDEELNGALRGIAGTVLAATLARAGWQIGALPGEPVTLSCGEQSIRPFDVTGKLAAGELTAEAWQQQCASAGIARLELAAPPEQSGDAAPAAVTA